MQSALLGKKRFIATPRISKHRIFAWLNQEDLANDGTIVFARDDDYFFGVLHSKPHELWSLRQGTSLEDRPRYTPTTSFETFPFPWPPGKEPKNDPRVKAIAAAARELVQLRDAWLNPPPTPPVDDKAVDRGRALAPSAVERFYSSFDGGGLGWGLEKRTLTNLYNERPAWLDLAHKKLDAAVAAAYGWPADLTDDQILEKLLALNLERAAEEEQAATAKPTRASRQKRQDELV